MVVVADEREELLASFRVVTEHAEHGAGDGAARQLLYAAHHHAHVTESSNITMYHHAHVAESSSIIMHMWLKPATSSCTCG